MDYINKEYLLRGESIAHYYLKFKEFLYHLMNRYILGLSGNYMDEKDEMKMIGEDILHYEKYENMTKELVERRVSEMRRYNRSSKKIQSFLRCKLRKWYITIKSLIKIAKEEKLQNQICNP